MPFPRYSPILKLLTLALFAYVATVFAVEVPWGEVLLGTVLPKVSLQADYIVTVVAIFGTTISPYLFFWQASQEVEEQRAAEGEEPLKEAPEQAREQLSRIKLDTYIGMGFSNLVAFFIMLTAAVTLHVHGVTDIQTSAQAAEALRPIAGDFAFVLFAAGIVGTGLLAVPVLAGSAAYAVAETFRWPIGLGLTLLQARGFYAILSIATLLGVAMNFTAHRSHQGAVLERGHQRRHRGADHGGDDADGGARRHHGPFFTVKRRLKVLGWLATVTMAAAVVAMENDPVVEVTRGLIAEVFISKLR